MSTPLLWAYNPIYERTDVEFNLRRSVARRALASLGNLPYRPHVMAGRAGKLGTVERGKPQVFRRVTAVLAVVALCGHGLAMLVTGALLPHAQAHASDSALFIELCTAEGVVLVRVEQGVEQEADPGAGDSPDGHGGHPNWHDCPICTVFLQQVLVAPASQALVLDAPADAAVNPAGILPSPRLTIAYDCQARAPPISA